MSTQVEFDGDTLTVERIYDAAQAEVFEAWVDAAKTTHWWGCAQTSRVVSTIDQQPGGRYQHLMHIDGVGEYLIDGTVLDYDPPRLLAYRVPGMEEGAEMIVRVTFSALGDRTRVTLTQARLPNMLQDAVSAGWTASFERLAAFFAGARRAA